MRPSWKTLLLILWLGLLLLKLLLLVFTVDKVLHHILWFYSLSALVCWGCTTSTFYTAGVWSPVWGCAASNVGLGLGKILAGLGKEIVCLGVILRLLLLVTCGLGMLHITVNLLLLLLVLSLSTHLLFIIIKIVILVETRMNVLSYS